MEKAFKKRVVYTSDERTYHRCIRVLDTYHALPHIEKLNFDQKHYVIDVALAALG